VYVFVNYRKKKAETELSGSVRQKLAADYEVVEILVKSYISAERRLPAVIVKK